jgi:hypothetical protein
MSDSHATYQSRDRGVVKDISYHPVGFALVETAFGSTSDDSARILATMLKEGKALCDFCGDIEGRVVQKKTEDAAHCPDGKQRVSV